MKTLNDLIEHLKQLDEVTLLEILDINAEQVVDRFQDVIELRYEEINSRVENSPIEEEEGEFTGELSWETPDSETLFDDD